MCLQHNAAALSTCSLCFGLGGFILFFGRPKLRHGRTLAVAEGAGDGAQLAAGADGGGAQLAQLAAGRSWLGCGWRQGAAGGGAQPAAGRSRRQGAAGSGAQLAAGRS